MTTLLYSHFTTDCYNPMKCLPMLLDFVKDDDNGTTGMLHESLEQNQWLLLSYLTAPLQYLLSFVVIPIATVSFLTTILQFIPLVFLILVIAFHLWLHFLARWMKRFPHIIPYSIVEDLDNFSLLMGSFAAQVWYSSRGNEQGCCNTLATSP